MTLTDHQRHHRRHQLNKQGHLCGMGRLPCLNCATVAVTFFLRSGKPIRTTQMCAYHYGRLLQAISAPYTVEPITANAA